MTMLISGLYLLYFQIIFQQFSINTGLFSYFHINIIILKTKLKRNNQRKRTKKKFKLLNINFIENPRLKIL